MFMLNRKFMMIGRRVSKEMVNCAVMSFFFITVMPVYSDTAVSIKLP